MPARSVRVSAASVLLRAAVTATAVAVAVGLGLPSVAAQAATRPPAQAPTLTLAAPSVVLGAGAAPASMARASGRVDRPARARASATRVVLTPAERVLREAAALAGRPYLYGGSGPTAFDCSGFTRYVFAHAVGRALPHNAAAQYALSHKIARSAIRPGDLVFFTWNGYVYHVGIYAGHGLIWHAPHSGDHVRLAAIFTSSWVAGRVL